MSLHAQVPTPSTPTVPVKSADPAGLGELFLEYFTQPVATVLASVGIIGAALISYAVGSKNRKQLERHHTETHSLADTQALRDRFTTITTQLADPAPAIRTAAVSALEALADDWLERNKPRETQACINVICDYLRTPYEPPTRNPHLRKQTRRTHRTKYDYTDTIHDYPHDDLDTRHAMTRIIAAHLQSHHDHSWSTFDYDLTGAYLHNTDLAGATFSGKTTSFQGATFSGEITSFRDARFRGMFAWFNGARFSSQQTSFDDTTFGSDYTSFDSAAFSSNTRFDDARFSSKTTSFQGATFSGESTSFRDARFNCDYASFRGATFSGEITWFDGATFCGEDASFNDTTFGSDYTSFDDTTFGSDYTSFDGTTFGSEHTRFDITTFGGKNTSFDGATFSGADVSFDGAAFSSERTWFVGTTFGSERTLFEDPQVWVDVRVDWERHPDSVFGPVRPQPASVYPRKWPPTPTPLKT